MKAFPRQITFNNGISQGKWIDDGMELRDYFAAKAMQGFVLSGLDLMTIQDDAICQASYDLADAMMEARKENK
jgi:hypothetical protein